MTQIRLQTAALVIAVGILWAGGRAALTAAPPAAKTTVVEPTVPGLTLLFESQKDKAIDARPARLIALNVPAGTSPTPFLAPGPFKATFEGYIDQKLRGDYDIVATGAGKLTVTINNKPAFDGELGTASGEKVTLKKGKNKIVAVYESPADGDAIMRLKWSGEDFPAEPINPALFTHATSGESFTQGLRLREGRALFADLHCVRCHTDPALTDLKDGMPELAKDAPNLEEIGSRLKPAWIARWISNPKALRPDTSMPNLFHGKAGSTVQEAADVAAYLATLGKAADDAKAPGADAVTAGGRIIARLGCIGCHTLPDKEVGADPARVPWHFIKAKYQPAALVEFLKQPEKHYAWIRMPNFRLTDDDARKVAAYLLANSADLEGAAVAGDAGKGKQLVQSAGCVNCHGLKVENQFAAPTLASLTADKLSKGCLAKDEAARGKAPDFQLDNEHREALLAFVATDCSSLRREALPEFAERQISELRCIACHSRDARQDLWDDLLKETEALSKGDVIDPESGGGGSAKSPPGEPAPGTGDQQRPPLTFTGEKLHGKWMSRFVAGKMDYKPRTWMLARMPGFATRAEGITKGLALEHGVPIEEPESPAPDAELATTGKMLVGRNGGFSCIQCHGIATVPPISPFEAPSINFKYVNERLRKDYYDRWMRNPPRMIPTTKMPAFADGEGKTSLRDVLDGDATKQFDAIWNYLQAGRAIEHPEQESK
jgi:mono/diheme cytochrome c family protein